MTGRGLLLVLLGAIAGATGVFATTVLASRDADADGLPWDEVRLLTEVLERVRRDYVETVDDAQLFENAVRGMVTNLDPYSQYLDATAFQDLRASTTGNYSGVGVEVSVREGQVQVVAPIEGTPADRAGIRPGDVIVNIAGIEVEADNAQSAISRLRGPAGTPVALEITREGAADRLRFNLVRSNVQVQSVRARLLEPGYGYLRISQFSETTARDFRAAYAGLVQANAGRKLTGLVLDLRNNPGGVLDAAVTVSDDFLERGLIVTASGRSQDANFRHEARSGDLLEASPLAVIVNGGSASAAEIVAGALKDNGRATIVGGRTFGKGSVQTVVPLSSGRAIKLTTSRYFTPSGASISGSGIAPDVAVDEAAVAPANGTATPDAALDAALGVLKQLPRAPAAG
jgi:carboxyl-terminal processing protease